MVHKFQKKFYLVWGRDPKTDIMGAEVVKGKEKAKKIKDKYKSDPKLKGWKFYIRKYE